MCTCMYVKSCILMTKITNDKYLLPRDLLFITRFYFLFVAFSNQIVLSNHDPLTNICKYIIQNILHVLMQCLIRLSVCGNLKYFYKPKLQIKSEIIYYYFLTANKFCKKPNSSEKLMVTITKFEYKLQWDQTMLTPHARQA